jgi:hypothetical protein
VLFGGTDGTARLNDIWEWDGTDWAQITPTQPNGFAYGPAARDGFVMQYDPRAERVVVIGGETDTGCVDDVWSWDGAGWTRHFPSGTSTLPSARRDAASFVDAVTGTLSLIGGGCGGTFSDEVWEFQLPVFSRWQSYGNGCVASNGQVPDLRVSDTSAPVIGQTMVLEVDHVPYFLGPTIGGLGFQRDSFLGLPIPAELTSLGLPGCFAWSGLDVQFTMGLPNAQGLATFSLALPNQANLLGFEVYFQAMCFEPPGYSRFASVSNGLAVRIGNS